MFEFTEDSIKSLGFKPLGFDVETSSLYGKEGGNVLSVAAFDPITMTSFYEEVRWARVVAEPEAMAVNKIDITKINDPLTAKGRQRLKLSTVDVELTKWLTNSKYRPTGFNVSCFDLERVTRHDLPKSYAKLGFNTLELNGLINSEALKRGIGPKVIKRALKGITIKSLASTYMSVFEKYLVLDDIVEHNALWDAVQSIEVLRILLSPLELTEILYADSQKS